MPENRIEPPIHSARDDEMARRPMIREGDTVVGYLVRSRAGARTLIVPLPDESDGEQEA